MQPLDINIPQMHTYTHEKYILHSRHQLFSSFKTKPKKQELYRVIFAKCVSTYFCITFVAGCQRLLYLLLASFVHATFCCNLNLLRVMRLQFCQARVHFYVSCHFAAVSSLMGIMHILLFNTSQRSTTQPPLHLSQTTAKAHMTHCPQVPECR